MKRLTDGRELLDGPLERDVLEANLRDLVRANRWLGGHELSRRAVDEVMANAADGRVPRVLDVGTGAGDMPLAFARQAVRLGRGVEIVAIDVRPEIVEIARRNVGAEPGITVELAQLGRLEHDDGAFDVAHASLVLHHLDPAAATELLAEMGRVASRTVIVNDLFRRWHAWLGAWLLARLATGNRYTRHDAALSVRRAYQPMEVARLGRAAGLRPERLLRDRLGHRYALVLRPPSAQEP